MAMFFRPDGGEVRIHIGPVGKMEITKSAGR